MKAGRYGKAGAASKLRVAERMGNHALELERAFAINRLMSVKNKHALPIIKRLVFDFDREVRKTAVEEMAERVGWKKTIKFISGNFKSPGNVPAAFFYFDRQVGGRKQVRKWLKRDWRAMKKQAVIDARKQKLTMVLDELGKPFSINGIPVFLGNLEPGVFGVYENGFIVLNASERILPTEFRECIAWHEFGEIFSHNTGMAFELENLRKTGKLQKYLEIHPFIDRMKFEKIEKNW